MSSDQFEITWFPALVDSGFGRSVEPEDDEIPLAGYRGQPVGFFALRRFRSQVEVRTSVGVLRGPVTRTQRREWLPVHVTGTVLGFVQSDGPEDGSRDIWRPKTVYLHYR